MLEQYHASLIGITVHRLNLIGYDHFVKKYFSLYSSINRFYYFSELVVYGYKYFSSTCSFFSTTEEKTIFTNFLCVSNRRKK